MLLRHRLITKPNSNRHRLVVTKRKPKQPRIKFKVRVSDRDTRILENHCDLCNDKLPKEADDIQYRINVLDEIDNSYESEHDKQQPRLLLCLSCTKEYKIPSYFVVD